MFHMERPEHPGVGLGSDSVIAHRELPNEKKIYGLAPILRKLGSGTPGVPSGTPGTPGSDLGVRFGQCSSRPVEWKKNQPASSHINKVD